MQRQHTLRAWIAILPIALGLLLSGAGHEVLMHHGDEVGPTHAHAACADAHDSPAPDAEHDRRALGESADVESARGKSDVTPENDHCPVCGLGGSPPPAAVEVARDVDVAHAHIDAPRIERVQPARRGPDSPRAPPMVA